MANQTQQRNTMLAGAVGLIVVLILVWTMRGHEDHMATHQDAALRTNFAAASQLSCTKNEQATLAAAGRTATDDAVSTYCTCTTRRVAATMTDDEIRAYSQPGVTLPPDILARVQDVAKTCPQP